MTNGGYFGPRGVESISRSFSSRGKFQELQPVLTSKREYGTSAHPGWLALRKLDTGEIMTLTYCCAALTGKDTEQLAKLVEAYTADHGLGNVDEVLDVSNCLASVGACEKDRRSLIQAP